VAVVAIAGDDLVALLDRHLHADDDRLLADVEVAEAADQPMPYIWPAFSSKRRILDADQLVVLGEPVRARSEPVLICPQLVATARSAMVASSVSPERCDITAV
jgi:hypothetical protein